MRRSRTGGGGGNVPVHVGVAAPPVPGKPIITGKAGKVDVERSRSRSVEDVGEGGREGWRLAALPHTSEARRDVAS